MLNFPFFLPQTLISTTILTDMDIQWTKTHASFLIMGGFVLHDADRSFLCTLDEEELISLFKNGEIKWPSITQKAIQDRSKADVVAKCIIIFHTAWFGIQAFARWNLSITELELVTLAYAMLNGATYWLWWNKPKDVRCPVPIYLKSLATSTSQRVQAARARRDGANPNVQSPTATDSEPMGNLNISQQAPVPGLAPPPSGGIIKRVEHFLESFGTSFRHRRQSMGPTLAIFLTFIWDPMKRLYTPIWHMLDTDTLDEDDLSRVPTFYSSKQIPHAKGLIRSTPVQVMTMLIIAFGSIHTFVWEQETQVWRMACVIIIMTPCFIPFVYLFLDIWKDGRPYNLLYYLLWTTFSVSLVMYIFARGVLIILPLVRLSDPPPDALKEYKWTEFLPHVGT